LRHRSPVPLFTEQSIWVLALGIKLGNELHARSKHVRLASTRSHVLFLVLPIEKPSASCATIETSTISRIFGCSCVVKGLGFALLPSLGGWLGRTASLTSLKATTILRI
jgi:hypothetical protein